MTLLGMPELPVCRRAPYKQILTFSGSEIGLTRPLLSVSDSDTDCEDTWPSRMNSHFPQDPRTANNSPKGTQQMNLVPSVIPDESLSNPVDLQRSVRKSRPSSAKGQLARTTPTALMMRKRTVKPWGCQ